MNKKQLVEFIPLSVFLIAEACRFLHFPYSTIAATIGGFISSCVYFYASYWLYASYNISPVNRIIAGLSFSTTIIALLFCLSNWPFGHVYTVISSVLLAVPLVTSLVNYKNTAYKQFLYRSIFFVVLLSMSYWYRSVGV